MTFKCDCCGENYPYHDSEWLHEQYIERDRSKEEIADECDVNTSTIEKYIDKFGLDECEIQRECPFCGTEFETNKLVDMECCTSEECLREWIDTKSRPVHENEHVLKVLHRGCRMGPNEIAEFLNGDTMDVYRQFKKSWEVRELIPWKNKEKMIEAFYDEELTPVEMAERWNCTTSIVNNYLTFLAVRSHDRERSRDAGRSSGRNYGPNWQRQRKRARRRDTPDDGNEPVCQRCGMTDSEHREKKQKGLQVHHIKPLEEFIEDGEIDFERANALENLITVCVECHSVWEKCQPLRVQPDFAAD